MTHINFILQGKGGVGKTVVASMLAQYYKDQHRPLLCIDTDPVNKTFAGWKALDVKSIDILEEREGAKQISPRKFDQIIDMVIQTHQSNDQSTIIIDNGASSFIPLSNYLITEGVIDLLTELGIQIRMHSVLTGGQSMLDTLFGFSELCKSFGGRAGIYAWINEFQGPCEHEGQPFENMSVYTDNRESVSGIVKIKQHIQTFAQALDDMLKQRKTFSEQLTDEKIGYMDRNRVRQIQTDIYSQLEKLGV